MATSLVSCVGGGRPFPASASARTSIIARTPPPPSTLLQRPSPCRPARTGSLTIVAASKASRKRNASQRSQGAPPPAGEKSQSLVTDAPTVRPDGPTPGEELYSAGSRGFGSTKGAFDPMGAGLETARARGQGAIGDEPPSERADVMRACVTSTAVFLFLTALLQGFSQNFAANIWGTKQYMIDAIWDIPSGGMPTEDIVAAVALAAGVTAARLVFLATWPDFAKATNNSNRMVLTNLGWLDLIWVSTLPGVSEELLFRGGLVASTQPGGWGVLFSAVLFGALHVTGRRNVAFSVWAGVVGLLYGGSLLVTGDLLVPVAAHSFANVASAAVWKARNPPGGGEGADNLKDAGEDKGEGEGGGKGKEKAGDEED